MGAAHLFAAAGKDGRHFEFRENNPPGALSRRQGGMQYDILCVFMDMT
jgi:hypothetical protein